MPTDNRTAARQQGNAPDRHRSGETAAPARQASQPGAVPPRHRMRHQRRGHRARPAGRARPRRSHARLPGRGALRARRRDAHRAPVRGAASRPVPAADRHAPHRDRHRRDLSHRHPLQGLRLGQRGHQADRLERHRDHLRDPRRDAHPQPPHPAALHLPVRLRGAGAPAASDAAGHRQGDLRRPRLDRDRAVQLPAGRDRQDCALRCSSPAIWCRRATRCRPWARSSSGSGSRAPATSAPCSSSG